MQKSISGTAFIPWFIAYSMLSAAATVFFPKIVNWLTPIVLKSNCGYPCLQGLLLFRGYGDFFLLALASLLAARAVVLRSRRIGTAFWVLYPVAAFATIGISLASTGNYWGLQPETLNISPPAPPLMAIAFSMFGLTLCLDFEETEGFRKSVWRTNLAAIPSGALFSITAIYVVAECILRQTVVILGAEASLTLGLSEVFRFLFPVITTPLGTVPVSVTAYGISLSLFLISCYLPKRAHGVRNKAA